MDKFQKVLTNQTLNTVSTDIKRFDGQKPPKIFSKLIKYLRDNYEIYNL